MPCDEECASVAPPPVSHAPLNKLFPIERRTFPAQLVSHAVHGNYPCRDSPPAEIIQRVVGIMLGRPPCSVNDWGGFRQCESDKIKLVAVHIHGQSLSAS